MFPAPHLAVHVSVSASPTRSDDSPFRRETRYDFVTGSLGVAGKEHLRFEPRLQLGNGYVAGDGNGYD